MIKYSTEMADDYGGLSKSKCRIWREQQWIYMMLEESG